MHSYILRTKMQNIKSFSKYIPSQLIELQPIWYKDD